VRKERSPCHIHIACNVEYDWVHRVTGTCETKCATLREKPGDELNRQSLNQGFLGQYLFQSHANIFAFPGCIDNF